MFGRKRRKTAVIRTLIGESTRIEGDLRFTQGCHIDGIVNGNVIAADADSEAYLSISEHGRVHGNVHVPILALSGTVEGDVHVTERAEFGATARVTGNVHYNLIEMAAGAEINGKLIHALDKPARAVRPQPVASGAVEPLSGAAATLGTPIRRGS